MREALPKPTLIPCSAPRSSFQTKLFLLFTVVTAVLTVLFVTLLVIREIGESRRGASEHLKLTAESFANNVRLPLYAENRDLLARYAQELVRLPQIRSVEITSANGTVLATVAAPH